VRQSFTNSKSSKRNINGGERNGGPRPEDPRVVQSGFSGTKVAAKLRQRHVTRKCDADTTHNIPWSQHMSFVTKSHNLA